MGTWGKDDGGIFVSACLEFACLAVVILVFAETVRPAMCWGVSRVPLELGWEQMG